MTGPSVLSKAKVGLDDRSVVETSTRWAEAFESDTFRLLTKRRFGFVVPSLLLFSAVFFVLWVMQSSLPNVARYRVYGYVNVNFIFTMAVFPFVWILGYLFVRYTRRDVYPLEEQLHHEFSQKGQKHE